MENIENLYKAIQNRHSRRKYTGVELYQDVADHLTKVAAELNETMTGTRVVFINKRAEEVLKGIVGSYGKITGSPAYAAFIADTRDANHQEKTGYLGEMFILEATTMNLGTCWVGGFFNPEVVARDMEIASFEKVLAVTPIGLVENEYSFMEKLFSGFAKGHSRKALAELLVDTKEVLGSKWVQMALEAARIAPSAVNRQPWRFSIEADGIKILLDNPKNTYKISKRLDCGIAMAHIEVAAKQAGVVGRWEYLEEPEVARFMV